jgi:hypothetical protein
MDVNDYPPLTTITDEEAHIEDVDVMRKGKASDICEGDNKT